MCLIGAFRFNDYHTWFNSQSGNLNFLKCCLVSPTQLEFHVLILPRKGFTCIGLTLEMLENPSVYCQGVAAATLPPCIKNLVCLQSLLQIPNTPIGNKLQFSALSWVLLNVYVLTIGMTSGKR